MFIITYAPLWETLRERRMLKKDLVAQVGISPSALKALSKGEPVSLNVLGTICAGLDVPIQAVVEIRKME